MVREYTYGPHTRDIRYVIDILREPASPTTTHTHTHTVGQIIVKHACALDFPPHKTVSADACVCPTYCTHINYAKVRATRAERRDVFAHNTRGES